MEASTVAKQAVCDVVIHGDHSPGLLAELILSFALKASLRLGLPNYLVIAIIFVILFLI